MKSFLRGLSLLEILIVIAILGVLAALSLPAIGRVRWASRVTVAKSDLHQMWLSMSLYRQDYDSGSFTSLSRIGAPDAMSLITTWVTPGNKSFNPTFASLLKISHFPCPHSAESGWNGRGYDYVLSWFDSPDVQPPFTLQSSGQQLGDRLPLFGTAGCTDPGTTFESQYYSFRGLEVNLGGSLFDFRRRGLQTPEWYLGGEGITLR